MGGSRKKPERRRGLNDQLPMTNSRLHIVNPRSSINREWWFPVCWTFQAALRFGFLVLASAVFGNGPADSPKIVFEVTSAYHHIRVIDRGGLRTLSFDGSMETQMLLENPLKGHFQYTEYFHTPWLWNPQLTNVLMIGLGGGSTQRAYEHYYPEVAIDTAEIDPMVAKIARDYFHLHDSPTQRVHIADGRIFLRRSQGSYGAIILDAYVQHRYGSSIPYQLATKEFFELASNHLETNGVLAYNVIGTLHSGGTDLLGSLYKTLKAVFPEVYLFPARDTQNVVLIATKSPEKADLNLLQQRAIPLLRSRRITLPGFWNLLSAFRSFPPQNSSQCSVLTDDYAPVDGLLQTGY